MNDVRSTLAGRTDERHEAILDATIEALHAPYAPILFTTERGFQAEFYCELRSALQRRGLLQVYQTAPGDAPDLILEAEVQKTRKIHALASRPDVLLHIPRGNHATTTDDRAAARRNNYVAYELKRKATPSRATSDLEKLVKMFKVLHYELGIFLNVGNDRTHIGSMNTIETHSDWQPAWRERVHSFAVSRNGTGATVHHGYWKGAWLEELAWLGQNGTS